PEEALRLGQAPGAVLVEDHVDPVGWAEATNRDLAAGDLGVDDLRLRLAVHIDREGGGLGEEADHHLLWVEGRPPLAESVLLVGVEVAQPVQVDRAVATGRDEVTLGAGTHPQAAAA